jgi:hypothetical protein
MGRQFDIFVDGAETEIKSLEPGATAGTVRNKFKIAKGQARNLIIDARESGLSIEEAKRGIRMGYGAYADKIDRVEIIGDSFYLDEKVRR